MMIEQYKLIMGSVLRTQPRSKLDTIYNWYISLSEPWQIAIFTVVFPALFGTFYTIKKILFSDKLDTSQTQYLEIPNDLCKISKNTRNTMSTTL